MCRAGVGGGGVFPIFLFRELGFLDVGVGAFFLLFLGWLVTFFCESKYKCQTIYFNTAGEKLQNKFG